MTGLYQQNGELFVWGVEFYVNCTVQCAQDTSKVMYTNTPQYFSKLPTGASGVVFLTVSGFLGQKAI